MDKKRESNIELLRIILAMGVIVLHYNNNGNTFELVKAWSSNQIIIYTLENIFICSVDTFILISGYFLCKKEQTNWIRVLKILLQTMLLGAAVFAISAIKNGVGLKSFIKGVLFALIPKNYYVTFYIVLCILAPYINKGLNHLNQNEWKKMLACCIGIFSIWAVISDVIMSTVPTIFGISPVTSGNSIAGYTIVNFFLMYIIGAYIRNNPIKIKTSKSIILLAGLTVIMTIWSLIVKNYHLPTEDIVWAYDNPLVILYSVLLFTLLTNCTVKYNKAINSLGKASFMVYLLHPIFIPYLNIEKFINGNSIVLLCHIVLSVVAVYIICFVVNIIYNLTVNRLIDRLFQTV